MLAKKNFFLGPISHGFTHGDGLTRVYVSEPKLRFGLSDENDEYSYGDYHHTPIVRLEHQESYDPLRSIIVKTPVVWHESNSDSLHESGVTSKLKDNLSVRRILKVRPIYKTVTATGPEVEITSKSKSDGYVKYSEGAYSKPIVVESVPIHESE